MQEPGVEGHPVRIEARVWVGPPFEAEDRRTMALFSLPVPLEQATDLRSARKLLRAAARRMESIVFAAIEDAKQ